jgi:hypothetical protein
MLASTLQAGCAAAVDVLLAALDSRMSPSQACLACVPLTDPAVTDGHTSQLEQGVLEAGRDGAGPLQLVHLPSGRRFHLDNEV